MSCWKSWAASGFAGLEGLGSVRSDCRKYYRCEMANGIEVNDHLTSKQHQNIEATVWTNDNKTEEYLDWS